MLNLLPDDLNIILIHYHIGTHECDIFTCSLRYQKSIKWIFMMVRELT